MLSDMTAAPLLRDRAEALRIVNICPFLPVPHFAFNRVYSLFLSGAGCCDIYIEIRYECKGLWRCKESEETRNCVLLLCIIEGKE